MDYNRLFLDTNIIVDLLLNRKPFNEDARSIFMLGAIDKSHLFTSSLSIINTNYLIHKTIGKENAIIAITQIRKLLTISSIDEIQVDLALENPGTDFEDAVQYFSAKAAGCEVIISRDKDGFKAFNIPCFTPQEFLETFYSSS